MFNLYIWQGTRAHWTAENITLHSVRCKNGLIHIDEHDLVTVTSLAPPANAGISGSRSVMNLCSGFSYCLSSLDSLYVWHGRGSLDQESKAAIEYAQGMAGNTMSIVELAEGHDEDEMFWMYLGDDDWAKADYWQWRPTTRCESRILRVDSDDSQPVCSASAYRTHHDLTQLATQVLIVPFLTDTHDRVFILDCVWEFFVLVGVDAHNKRKDIRLAVEVATVRSPSHSSPCADRAFSTLHVW
jgi:hypothetical protein